MNLQLDQIKRDTKLSPRDGTDPDTAQQYSECFDQLPPLVVFKTPDNDQYILVDGWHRYRAAEILELEQVPVETRYGSHDEAKEYALLANLRHGKPLTRKERRRVLEEFLKLHPERSNSWIAEDVGVSDHTVDAARERLETGSQIATLTILIGKDGKEYPRSIEQPARDPDPQPELDLDAETESETEDAAQVPMLGAFELNTVCNIDCVQALRELPAGCLDLIFADPPYNLGKQYGAGVDDNMPPDHYFSWCLQWFMGAYQALRPGGALYVMHYPEVTARWKHQLDGLLDFRRWITWVYPSNIGHSNGNWRRSHRTILYYTKGEPAYFKGEADPQPYKNPDDKRVAHLGKLGTTPYDWWEYNLVKNVSDDKTDWPNQLPVPLVRRIVLSSCPEDGVVCDPFMGSGSTAEAAVTSGRDWIGFEIEPAACKIATDRMAGLGGDFLESSKEPIPAMVREPERLL